MGPPQPKPYPLAYKLLKMAQQGDDAKERENFLRDGIRCLDQFVTQEKQGKESRLWQLAEIRSLLRFSPWQGNLPAGIRSNVLLLQQALQAFPHQGFVFGSLQGRMLGFEAGGAVGIVAVLDNAFCLQQVQQRIGAIGAIIGVN